MPFLLLDIDEKVMSPTKQALRVAFMLEIVFRPSLSKKTNSKCYF